MAERPTPETDAIVQDMIDLGQRGHPRLASHARFLERRLGEAQERLEVHPSGYDGIACRDETIAGLQSAHDKALARVRELEEALRRLRTFAFAEHQDEMEDATVLWDAVSAVLQEKP